ncbi:MAG: ferredoxin family protein [Deltaproteobacteria bacterium]|nr:ferredoxin family protein [Deltaproteobacteria bacterium]MBW2305662.1 ferredoxin family protein [Deltaproteobacteria bacterium]
MESIEKTDYKRVEVSVRHKWCKQCGICIEFCPGNVYDLGELGKPDPVRPELCTVCRMCEIRCPEFAITVDVQEE